MTLVPALLLPGSPIIAQESCTARAVSYLSDRLRITGALMRPPGRGPFPAVIYQHSSKRGQEKQPTLEAGTACFPFVTERNWVYFAPDRRGYGRSEGPSLTEALGNRRGLLLLWAVQARYQQESDDVLAGVEFLRSLPFVDGNRIAAVGYSLGGQILFLSASRRPDSFRAVVTQATGSGEHYSLLLREMIGAGRQIPTPILLQYARDDQQVPVQFSQDLADALRRAGKDVTLRVYPGGHDLFASEPRGPSGEWGRDLVDFFARHLSR